MDNEDQNNAPPLETNDESLLTQPAAEETPPQETPPQQEQQTAPESYAPFNAPEGQTIDEATHGELSALGKDLNLTQQQLQAIVDYGAKKVGDGMEAVRLEVLRKHQQWRDESEKDPEITGNIDHARRLIKNAGDEQFVSMIDETGIGNNPTFIRFCIKVGKLLGEDAFIKPEGGAAGASSDSLTNLAHSLYPDMK
jgi:hypothetical protein